VRLTSGRIDIKHSFNYAEGKPVLNTEYTYCQGVVFVIALIFDMAVSVTDN
jgi:predicted alpha-1,6-mannanase (GH76 family)